MCQSVLCTNCLGRPTKETLLELKGAERLPFAARQKLLQALAYASFGESMLGMHVLVLQ